MSALHVYAIMYDHRYVLQRGQVTCLRSQTRLSQGHKAQAKMLSSCESFLVWKQFENQSGTRIGALDQRLGDLSP